MTAPNTKSFDKKIEKTSSKVILESVRKCVNENNKNINQKVSKFKFQHECIVEFKDLLIDGSYDEESISGDS